MVDFRKMMLDGMTPERKKAYLGHEEYVARRVEDAEQMDAPSLVATFRYYMTQCTQPANGPEAPVYDSQLWYVLLPELLKRLEDKS